MPNSKVKKAQQVLEEISQDGRERYLAELRQKYIRDQTSMKNSAYIEGMEAGLEAGLETGKKQSQIELLKKVIKKKLDINTISDLTDIPVEEINKLISSNI